MAKKDLFDLIAELEGISWALTVIHQFTTDERKPINRDAIGGCLWTTREHLDRIVSDLGQIEHDS